MLLFGLSQLLCPAQVPRPFIPSPQDLSALRVTALGFLMDTLPTDLFPNHQLSSLGSHRKAKPRGPNLEGTQERPVPPQLAPQCPGQVLRGDVPSPRVPSPGFSSSVEADCWGSPSPQGAALLWTALANVIPSIIPNPPQLEPWEGPACHPDFSAF